MVRYCHNCKITNSASIRNYQFATFTSQPKTCVKFCHDLLIRKIGYKRALVPIEIRNETCEK